MKKLGYVLLGIGIGVVGADASSRPRLELRDVIDVLARYEINHQYIPPIPIPNLPPDKPQWFLVLGNTMPDEKQIGINDVVGIEYRKLPVIHELVHAFWYEKGFANHSEDEVDKESRKIYRKLYGYDPPEFGK